MKLEHLDASLYSATKPALHIPLSKTGATDTPASAALPVQPDETQRLRSLQRREGRPDVSESDKWMAGETGRDAGRVQARPQAGKKSEGREYQKCMLIRSEESELE